MVFRLRNSPERKRRGVIRVQVEHVSGACDDIDGDSSSWWSPHSSSWRSRFAEP
jgi:hypothetical protein